MTFLRLFAFIFFLVSANVALGDCAPDRVDLRGDWGQASYVVEVVDTPESRGRGLMFRESLPRRAGMLFVYERSQSVSFWMRNTLIPLDMIFVDAQGVVQHVHQNAIPLDETPIPGGDGILAVLEINGGQSQRIGIAPGTELRHPAFGAQARWACAVN
ncbi:DUF192 domain-containing protein [Tropicimonas sp. S265A]|uniref:DUF192 domain-containing protein n=1 Tax=Tropicimonas sp. S265A TaxID=3415134 RepID=UPI003C7C8B6C